VCVRGYYFISLLSGNLAHVAYAPMMWLSCSAFGSKLRYPVICRIGSSGSFCVCSDGWCVAADVVNLGFKPHYCAAIWLCLARLVLRLCSLGLPHLKRNGVGRLSTGKIRCFRVFFLWYRSRLFRLATSFSEDFYRQITEVGIGLSFCPFGYENVCIGLLNYDSACQNEQEKAH
jgi:hypothetical protein